MICGMTFLIDWSTDGKFYIIILESSGRMAGTCEMSITSFHKCTFENFLWELITSRNICRKVVITALFIITHTRSNTSTYVRRILKIFFTSVNIIWSLKILVARTNSMRNTGHKWRKTSNCTYNFHISI